MPGKVNPWARADEDDEEENTPVSLFKIDDTTPT